MSTEGTRNSTGGPTAADSRSGPKQPFLILTVGLAFGVPLVIVILIVIAVRLSVRFPMSLVLY
jgi:hypothetical protein